MYYLSQTVEMLPFSWILKSESRIIPGFSYKMQLNIATGIHKTDVTRINN